MALTQEQIDFFGANGYLSYGKILEVAEVERLRQEYDEEFEKAWRENSLNNLTLNAGADLEAKKQAPMHMLQILQMCERNVHFRRLIYDSRILDLVHDLLGPNLMLFHDQAFSKPPRVGGAVYWHQDNAYWRCRPATLITCWIALDDADRDNGAMQVIPGSHLKPVWHELSENTNLLLDSTSHVDASQAVVIDLPAGGCMLHHCQTLHYTQPNMTDRPRRAFAMHFMQPGTVGNDGQVIRAGFSNPVLRMNM